MIVINPAELNSAGFVFPRIENKLHFTTVTLPLILNTFPVWLL